MFGIDNYNLPIIDFSNFNVEQLLKALVFGGSILLIGMLTIFGVLCILWLFLVLFKLVFHDLPKKRSEKQPLTQVVTKETSTEIETVDDTEIIAVISAAIAMAENDNSGAKFRVVSFRRT